MSNKIYCPVCQVKFIYREVVEKGLVVLCPVCGAKVEVLEVNPELETRKYPQEPIEEISQRIDAFAGIKGFVFNENKEMVRQGLMEKKSQYGDFYCPCRFDNIPENVCPCLETRMGQVQKEGSCL